MPSDLALAHIEAQRRLREIVARAVGNTWQALGSYDERDVPRWLDQVVPLVLTGRRSSASLTDAYLAQARGRRPVGAANRALDRVRGGADPREVYRRPFVTLWSALGDSRPFDDARSSAGARAAGMAAFDVQATMRETAATVQEADDGIYGYRRVADGNACDFCQALDGAYLKSADDFALHNNCGCGVEELTRPHPRAAFLPSGASVHDDFAIHEHGEMGAVLTAPDQQFTGPGAIA